MSHCACGFPSEARDFSLQVGAACGGKHRVRMAARRREDRYSLRLSVAFQSRRYRDTSTDHSCCGERSTMISSAVPYPRSKAAAETSQFMNSLDFHRLAAALHRQYKVYSSQQPSMVGCKYEPSSYGLHETTYRVRHFEHSTQCRIRRITGPGSLAWGRFASEVVFRNTHLNRFQHNHYDPQE